MRLIITIDTEEDEWYGYGLDSYSVTNIDKIIELQELFDEYRVKPTYLITYPVAANERSIKILKKIEDEKKCEIGSHCHPWSTPPYEEEFNPVNSMLCNLSEELQFKKMKVLHETIKKNFGIEPVSFRCGRWGYNSDVARNLYKLGYKVDSSISAYTDWSLYHGPDTSYVSPKPFRFNTNNIFEESANGHMLQVPATVGFLQKNYSLSNTVLQMLKNSPVNRLRLIGILYKLNILNKVELTPELYDSDQMIKLTKRMAQNNYKIVNMHFHSSTLEGGLTPFVKDKDDEKRFLNIIREYLKFTRDAGIESITLSESLHCVN
ncbi:MAG: hypothetical protein ACE5D6_08390 [Candidatus Zixiibacteriota bacterium]